MRPLAKSASPRPPKACASNSGARASRASAKDWDLAAADLIAHEAGACLTDLTGDKPIYNCQDVRHGALIACRATEHKEMLDLAIKAINKTGQS